MAERQAGGSGWSEHLHFFGRFLRRPRTVGAIAPSSRSLARRMVAGLDLDRDARVVELGPGTGAFTHEIVTRLSPVARYLAVDIDSTFVERLQERWPHLDCVCASASALPALASARDLAPVDHIISGLPFASLPVETTRDILDAIGAILRVGGTFTTFQYVHAFQLAPAVTFRRAMTARLGAPPQTALVVWNLPPAWVHHVRM